MNRRELLKLGASAIVAPLLVGFVQETPAKPLTNPQKPSSSVDSFQLEPLLKMIRDEGVACRQTTEVAFLDNVGKPSVVRWRKMRCLVAGDSDGWDTYHMYAQTAQEMAIESRSYAGRILYVYEFGLVPLTAKNMNMRRGVVLRYVWAN